MPSTGHVGKGFYCRRDRNSSEKCVLNKDLQVENCVLRLPLDSARSATTSRGRAGFQYHDTPLTGTLMSTPHGRYLYVTNSGKRSRGVTASARLEKLNGPNALRIKSRDTVLSHRRRLSTDGKSVLLGTISPLRFTLPSPDAAFDEVWTQKPRVFSLGDRKQGEAISYSADGQSVFATSEGKHQPLFTVKRQQP